VIEKDFHHYEPPGSSCQTRLAFCENHRPVFFVLQNPEGRAGGGWKKHHGTINARGRPGTVLKITVNGPDEADMIHALDDLFERKFDDEDKE